jgi:lipid-A-disaccharide synthase-like uncharacterized protein
MVKLMYEMKSVWQYLGSTGNALNTVRYWRQFVEDDDTLV